MSIYAKLSTLLLSGLLSLGTLSAEIEPEVCYKVYLSELDYMHLQSLENDLPLNSYPALEDEKGLYILVDHDGFNHYVWYCRHCESPMPTYLYVCSKCHKPR